MKLKEKLAEKDAKICALENSATESKAAIRLKKLSQE
jgi:hypothetical protein